MVVAEGRRLGLRHLAELRDNPSVEAIGLRELPERLREVSHLARVNDRDWELLRCHRESDGQLEAARRLEHDAQRVRGERPLQPHQAGLVERRRPLQRDHQHQRRRKAAATRSSRCRSRPRKAGASLPAASQAPRWRSSSCPTCCSKTSERRPAHRPTLGSVSRASRGCRTAARIAEASGAVPGQT